MIVSSDEDIISVHDDCSPLGMDDTYNISHCDLHVHVVHKLQLQMEPQ